MKISKANLARILEELNGRELDFYLYIVKRQNEFGQVRDIYYRDVMKDLNMPRSTFYYILDELAWKGFIQHELDGKGNNTIVLSNNAFLNEADYKQGYININLDYILSPEFIELNVNIKRFLLRFLNMPTNQDGFVRISKEKLRQYKVLYSLEILKKLFDINIVGEIYYIRSKSILRKSRKNDLYLRVKHELLAYMRRYKILYDSDRILNDAIAVITNNRRANNSLLLKAFDAILKKKSLEPKLMNYICSKKIQFNY